MAPRCPLVAIVGATGTGKSQLAVSLAQRFNGEIINGDALQMYEGLPITTNKLSLRERKGVPHHLLGCIKLDDEPWTVMQFIDRASQVIDEIRSRGSLPILVGGTHYYTQSLLFKHAVVDEKPACVTPETQVLHWPILEASTSEMLEELRNVDPKMAMRWHPNDRRKIRRSLEVYLTTGKRASDVYEQQHQVQASSNSSDANGNLNETGVRALVDSQSPLRYDTLIFWTHAPSDILNVRLDQRVESMVSKGLIDEVNSMYKYLQIQSDRGRCVDRSRGIWVAIGFKEFLPFMVDGSCCENLRLEAVERIQNATRQYAKRQIRWIRLKLQEALQAENCTNRMFQLDASDLSQWSNEVGIKASDITSEFLNGRVLPLPASISDSMGNRRAIIAKAANCARLCKACDKTLMSEKEWFNHLQSKGHRSAVRPKIDWEKMYPKHNQH